MKLTKDELLAISSGYDALQDQICRYRSCLDSATERKHRTFWEQRLSELETRKQTLLDMLRSAEV